RGEFLDLSVLGSGGLLPLRRREGICRPGRHQSDRGAPSRPFVRRRDHPGDAAPNDTFHRQCRISAQLRSRSVRALRRGGMAPESLRSEGVRGTARPAASSEEAVILYENAPEPIVRIGEFDLTGRRVTARALPYGTPGGSRQWSFDPIERRFHIAARDGAIAAGPHDPEPWREAFLKAPPGLVAVNGDGESEEIRGSFLAATVGAARALRGVFLIDPPAAALPPEPSEAFV